MNYANKEAATTAGQAVLDELRSHMSLAGVKLDIWENLGWHWALRHEHFGVHEDADGGYFVLASPGGRGRGRIEWHLPDNKNHTKRVRMIPALLKRVMKLAHQEIDELTAAVNHIDAMLESRSWARWKRKQARHNA